jgi:hypothetical protein
MNILDANKSNTVTGTMLSNTVTGTMLHIDCIVKFVNPPSKSV